MKSKKGLFLIFGVLFCMIGFTLFILGTTDLDFLIIKEYDAIFIILGVLFIVGAVVFIAFYINSWVKSSKELTVGEKDERNIMIRGKAAEKTIFITVFMMLALEFLLMILKENLAAILVSVVMFIASFLNIIFIVIYQKKL